MCLKINSSIHKKLYKKYIPIKIQEDLEVYKCVKADWNEKVITRVWSPVQFFVYDINKEYCTKFGIINKEVYEGFHSYLNKMYATRSILYSSGSNAVAICIIPKGSKVFLSNNFIDIVSNKIRIIGVEKL